MQGTHSNCIFKFPVYFLSNRKFSKCKYTSFVTITYTKLTKQTYPASKNKWKFSRKISKHILPLESGNLQLEQTKFPVFSLCFGKISKFPVFSLTEHFWPFSRKILKHILLLESGHLQLEQTKFPVFSLCFGKISKFPVFSLTEHFLAIFPVFLVQRVPWQCDLAGLAPRLLAGNQGRSPIYAFYDFLR